MASNNNASLADRDENTRTVFALFYGPCLGTLVLGTMCATREKADMLLADRAANGDAFPGERVRELSVEQYRRHERAVLARAGGAS